MPAKPTKKCGKCRKAKPCKCGRPTRYRAAYCDRIVAFFSVERYRREVKREKTTTRRDGAIERDVEYTLVPNGLPMFSKFARHIGVHVATLHEWAHGKRPDGSLKHPEFAEAYKAAKALQKEHLIDNGLAGLYPPASYIFTAKNIAGMRDKIETDVTTKGERLTAAESILAAMNRMNRPYAGSDITTPTVHADRD